MLRIIGDVHGCVDEYRKIVDGCEWSVQLGDMGFKHTYDELDKYVDSSRHRFIPGNHDEYPHLPAHALYGEYGNTIHGGVNFMYVRGAYSIDKMRRIPSISWWEEEEISRESGEEFVKVFERLKPEIVLSHECPGCCNEFVLPYGATSNNSWTMQVLSEAYSRHQPRHWYFGHHHVGWAGVIGKTAFQCVDTLSYVDLDRIESRCHNES